MKKCESKCKGTNAAWALVIVGAINWLLIGAFDWNLVELLFGNIQWLERLIYILVGLSGILLLAKCPCTTCKESCAVKDMKCGSCDTGKCECAPETDCNSCEGDSCECSAGTESELSKK